MAQLGKLWPGRCYGTNTGNLFVELSQTGPDVTGTLRLLDAVFGVAVYKITGTFEDALHLEGQPAQPPAQGVELGALVIEGRLTEEGNLRGTWNSSLGTGGTFDLYPHDINSPLPTVKPDGDIPEQVYARNITLGAIRLYGNTVKLLIQYIKEDFVSGRVVVTYNLRGSQVTKYAEDFLIEATTSGTIIDYLKIQVQEPEAHGINKLVIVEFNSNGANEVRVQGIRESWVIGKAEALAGYLRNHQRALITTYKRFGLNLNLVIFLATIVLLPSITSLTNRFLFVLGVFMILQALLAVHARLVPIASVQMGDAKSSVFQRIWPTTLSWFIGVSSSLIAALLFYWLTK